MVDRSYDNPNTGNIERTDVGRAGGAGAQTGVEKRDVSEKVEDAWDRFRMKTRQKWNQLTDKDIDTYRNQSRNDFVGYVNQKTGGNRVDIERDVDTFARETNHQWKM